VPRNPVSGRRAPLHFDPPEHPRYRRPLNAVFSKQRVAALEPNMRETARELVAALVDAGGGDAVRGLSSPLAGLIFGMFIGISPDRAWDLNAHSDRFESAQFHQRPEIAEEENLYLYRVFRELVAERRAHPLDPAEDVVSALLDVTVDGTPLDGEFIAGSIRQLLIAAHVAPSAAIASAIRHLADEPSPQDELRRDPSLISAAGDELLRLYTLNQGFARTATRRTTIATGASARYAGHTGKPSASGFGSPVSAHASHAALIRSKRNCARVLPPANGCATAAFAKTSGTSRPCGETKRPSSTGVSKSKR
jgi:cytochrome P450